MCDITCKGTVSQSVTVTKTGGDGLKAVDGEGRKQADSPSYVWSAESIIMCPVKKKKKKPQRGHVAVNTAHVRLD